MVKAFIGFLYKNKHEEDFNKIETSISSYITPTMVGLVLAGIALVFYNKDTLYVYFSTNSALNGVIISVLLFSVCRAFYNNILLWRAANFIKDVDIINDSDHVGPDEMKFLKRSLKTKGGLLDTKQMYDIVTKIEHYGHIQFTDHDARIIKSKFGYRIRNNMGSVGFLAGILIMLGLLGTFLGLLKTIDAVGETMAAMSSTGVGQVNLEEQMSGFIESLSAPLKGMGVAFSSSLFGLSGSLIIGFLNYVCGAQQNTLIEGVSRWIDENIPKPSAKMQKLSSSQKIPDSGDLKAWLASFVFLSNKMNKRLGQLFLVLSNSENSFSQYAKYAEQICENQSKMQVQIKDGIDGFGAKVSSIVDKMQENNNEFKGFSSVLNSGLKSVSVSVDSSCREASAIKTISQGIEKSLASIGGIVKINSETNKTLANQINDKQKGVISAIETVGKDISSISSEVNSIKNASLSGNSLMTELQKINSNINLAISRVPEVVKKDDKEESVDSNAYKAVIELAEIKSVLESFMNSQRDLISLMGDINIHLKSEQKYTKDSDIDISSLINEINQDDNELFDFLSNNSKKDED